jgi:hypothetical protein
VSKEQFMNHTQEKENGELVIVLDLQSEQAAICDGKWMQSRYYCDDGDRVRDFLSFNSVFEVNPTFHVRMKNPRISWGFY